MAATLLRDVATPLVGLGLAIQQVLGAQPIDWGRLILIGGMIGLPAFTFLDWRQTSAPPAPPELPAGSTPTAGPST